MNKLIGFMLVFLCWLYPVKNNSNILDTANPVDNLKKGINLSKWFNYKSDSGHYSNRFSAVASQK